MSRRRLGLSTGLTAALAAFVALPAAAQPASYGVPQPRQQQECKPGGHPTVGAIAGGLAGAALGASLGLQIGAMLGSEIGAHVGKTKCPAAKPGPAYAVSPQGYAPAPYQQPYGYPQAAYPQPVYPQALYSQAGYPQMAYAQSAYPQPVHQAPAYPQAAPPPGYATRAYGVWPYGEVYVTPAASGRRGS